MGVKSTPKGVKPTPNTESRKVLQFGIMFGPLVVGSPSWEKDFLKALELTFLTIYDKRKSKGCILRYLVLKNAQI